jgi:hypothetical protein
LSPGFCSEFKLGESIQRLQAAVADAPDGGPRQAGLFGGTVQPNSTDT